MCVCVCVWVWITKFFEFNYFSLCSFVAEFQLSFNFNWVCYTQQQCCCCCSCWCLDTLLLWLLADPAVATVVTYRINPRIWWTSRFVFPLSTTHNSFSEHIKWHQKSNTILPWKETIKKENKVEGLSTLKPLNFDQGNHAAAWKIWKNEFTFNMSHRKRYEIRLLKLPCLKIRIGKAKLDEGKIKHNQYNNVTVIFLSSYKYEKREKQLCHYWWCWNYFIVMGTSS